MLYLGLSSFWFIFHAFAASTASATLQNMHAADTLAPVAQRMAR
jgi:hypothetical protein